MTVLSRQRRRRIASLSDIGSLSREVIRRIVAELRRRIGSPVARCRRSTRNVAVATRNVSGIKARSPIDLETSSQRAPDALARLQVIPRGVMAHLPTRLRAEFPYRPRDAAFGISVTYASFG